MARKQAKKNTKDTAKKNGKEEDFTCAGCLKVYKTKQGLDRHQPQCLENPAKATPTPTGGARQAPVAPLPQQQSQLAHAAALMAADPDTLTRVKGEHAIRSMIGLPSAPILPERIRVALVGGALVANLFSLANKHRCLAKHTCKGAWTLPPRYFLA